MLSRVVDNPQPVDKQPHGLIAELRERLGGAKAVGWALRGHDPAFEPLAKSIPAEVVAAGRLDRALEDLISAHAHTRRPRHLCERTQRASGV